VCSGMSGRERISWSLPVGLATGQTLHKANNGFCRCLSDFSSAMRAVAIGRAPTPGVAVVPQLPLDSGGKNRRRQNRLSRHR
jgi:hypothetical protein